MTTDNEVIGIIIKECIKQRKSIQVSKMKEGDILIYTTFADGNGFTDLVINGNGEIEYKSLHIFRKPVNEHYPQKEGINYSELVAKL